MKNIRLEDDQLDQIQKDWIENQTRNTYRRQKIDFARLKEYIERMEEELNEADGQKKIDPYYFGAMKYFIEALKEVAKSMAINESDLRYIHWWAEGTLSTDPKEVSLCEWREGGEENENK